MSDDVEFKLAAFPKCNKNCQFFTCQEPVEWIPKNDFLYVCYVHGAIHICNSDFCILNEAGQCWISKKYIIYLQDKYPLKSYPNRLERFVEYCERVYNSYQFCVNAKCFINDTLRKYETDVERKLNDPRVEITLKELAKLLNYYIKKDIKKLSKKSLSSLTESYIANVLENIHIKFEEMCFKIIEDMLTSHTNKLQICHMRGNVNSVVTRPFRKAVSTIITKCRLSDNL